VSSALIVDGLRTAIGAFGGSLASVRPDDLAALVIRRVVDRRQIDPGRISDVILGCANQAGEDNRNVARMAVLLSDLPIPVPGITVNRLCASGMSAVSLAAASIRAGDGDLYLAGGVESMTRAPYVLSKGAAPWARDGQMYDTSIGWRFVNRRMQELYGTDSMGQTAENVAEVHGITRDEQDRFAAGSQRKAAAARDRGRHAVEITPVEVPGPAKGTSVEFATDEFVKPGTTPEVLARLRPAFRSDGGGSVTAGNSSGINDGACVLLMASEDSATALGLPGLARVVASCAVGVEPRLMGMGPVPATRKVLAMAGLSLDQMEVIEINEAFASQSLACLRELGVPDEDPRVNPNGGAIALGHPLGMSGARLVLTAAHELKERSGRYALCTMCVGVGQGTAMILERV
jgi:3-oxoadipyl-CoA thiolase